MQKLRIRLLLALAGALGVRAEVDDGAPAELPAQPGPAVRSRLSPRYSAFILGRDAGVAGFVAGPSDDPDSDPRLH